MTGNVVELHGATVAYEGRQVLAVPDLGIRRGEVLAVLGENGSGKTTLLRLLGLLVRPGRGRVAFDGKAVDFRRSRHLLTLRRRMAAVMQEPLLCRMTVRQNVALGLRFRRVSRRMAEERVEAWLRRLSISDLGDRQASTLSGGEARRASLARAMVLRPEVLFLDEPFSALDAPTRLSQLEVFRSVLAETGVTAVFATHDRGEAIALGHRVAILMPGRIAQVDDPETVFRRPRDVEVARFVGMDTLIPGRIVGREGGMVQVDCGPLRLGAEGDLGAGTPVWVGVRPEEIDLENELDPDPEAGRNVISGLITKTLPAEAHCRVEIDCGHRVVAIVPRVRYRDLGLEVGRTVRAAFRPGAAHLLPR
jgi:ABC-type Fe3+/spermidine/putrescine transport system ATPase subunit